MLGGTWEGLLYAVPRRCRRDCEGTAGAVTTRDSFVPALGGAMVVASGLGLCMGASEGCGGGVARWRSSRSTYVPIMIRV
jgi:hypothetical protein